MLLLGALLSMVVATVARAQVSLIENGPPRFEWKGRIQADFLNQFETETDGNDDFDVWRLGVSGDVGGPINESILLGFAARYERSEYEFDLAPAGARPPGYGTNALPKDPWNGLDTIDLVPSTTVLVGSRGQVVVSVPIRWSAEVGSDRNAFSAGLSALASWQITDRLRAGLGLGFTSQIEDDEETFPIVALDWQIHPTLRFSTSGSWVQGGEAALVWEPNEALALLTSAGYERNRFRLDDNGTTLDTDGVGEVRSVPVEVGLRLRFPGGARFDVRAGFGFDGRLRVETRSGNRLYDEDFDPAPRVGVGFTLPLGGSGP